MACTTIGFLIFGVLDILRDPICAETANWPQVENRRSYNIASVRPCVRTYVRTERIISGTAPRIFLKFGTKLGNKIIRNVTRPLFLIFALLRGYPPPKKGPKTPYLPSFWGFWDFEKKPSRVFFLNFPKMCQKKLSIM